MVNNLPTIHSERREKSMLNTSNTPTPFTLGVNYWPRRKAMYWWSNFDQGEVREDFALMRELGMDMVRIFLLWDDFQPAPDAVSNTALNHLIEVCNIAAGQELKLNVTFFTGHMSGPNWPPRWLLNGAPTGQRQVVSQGHAVSQGYHNPFHDSTALTAAHLQLQTVVGTLRDHSAIGLWNLGNEPDIFAQPDDSTTGRAWVRDMVRLIRSLDNTHPITFGLHTDSLLHDNGLRVDQVYAETDLAVMHAYPMYQDWVRSALDPDFVPFCGALTAALCGKPVLFEEFGGPTITPGQPSQVIEWTGFNGQTRQQYMASEEDLAAYFEAVLPRLHQNGGLGALLWCFADYSPELWNRPPCDHFIHERHFGLVRPDGTLKPHAKTVQQFAAGKPTVQPIPDWAKLPVQADSYYQNPGAAIQKLYQLYLTRQGITV
jgi:endo-1,4-beta-mannosidase